MANIVFSFDAETYGVLAAIDLIMGAFDKLASATEKIGAQFIDMNTKAELMGTAWGGLFAAFSEQGTQATDAITKTSRAAQDLQYQLQRIGEEAAQSSVRHQEALQQMQEQEQNLTQNYQDQIAQRNQVFNDQMRNMQEQHAAAIAAIQEQEQTLTENFQDKLATIRQSAQDQTLTHQEKIDGLRDKSYAERIRHEDRLAMLQLELRQAFDNGNIQAADRIKLRIKAENDQYNLKMKQEEEAIEKENAHYNLQKTRAQEKADREKIRYQEALERLKTHLDDVNRKYNDQTEKLKQRHQYEIDTLRKHYEHQERLLAEHLNKENEAYAYQQKRLDEQRAHDIAKAAQSTSSGGGGRQGVGLSPPPRDHSVQLFKQYGVDPVADPQRAGLLLNAYTIGGKWEGHDFGQGIRGTTNLTTGQAQSITTGAIAEGIDPTKIMAGGRNYVQLVSDIAAFTSATRPDLSPKQRFNMIQYAMEEMLAGQTGKSLQSLGRLGISKQQLEKAGLQFNNKGQPVDPSQTLAYLAKSIEGGDGYVGVAPGLGEKQGFNVATGKGTFFGMEQAFISAKERIFQEIASPFDKGGLWKQLEEQLGRLLKMFLEAEPTIVKFGQTFFQWVTTELKNFVDWLQSKQAHELLNKIAAAFRAIGDALQWAGQHKDVVVAMLAMIATQGISEKLMGGGGIAGNMLGAVGTAIFASKGVPKGAQEAYDAAMKERTALTSGIASASRDEFHAGNLATKLEAGLGYTPDPVHGPMYLSAKKDADTALAKSGILHDTLLTMSPGSSGFEALNAEHNKNRDEIAQLNNFLAQAKTDLGYTPNMDKSKLLQAAQDQQDSKKAQSSMWSWLMRHGSTPAVRSTASKELRAASSSGAFQGLMASGYVGSMGLTPDMPLEGLVQQLEKQVETKSTRQGVLGNMLSGMTPADAGYDQLKKDYDATLTKHRDASRLQTTLGKTLGYVPNVEEEQKLAKAKDALLASKTKGSNLSDALLSLGPEPRAPGKELSLFEKGVGGFFTGTGDRYATGVQFGKDSGIVKSAVHGASGVRSLAGAVPSGVSTFEKIAADTGTGIHAARFGGLISKPLETISVISKETSGTLGAMLTKGISGIIGMAAAIPGFIAGIPALLAGLGPAIMAAFTGLGPMLMGIAAAALPIMLVVAAVAGLIAILVINRDKIMPFINMLGKFFAEQIALAKKAIQDFIKEVQARLGPALGPGSVLHNVIMFFARFWEGAWGGIQTVFKGVWNIVSGIIQVAWALISGIILIGLDLLGGKWGKAWEDIKKMLKGVWDGIWKIIGGVLQVVGGLITGFFGGLWGSIGGGLKGLWDGITGFFGGIGDFIRWAVLGYIKFVIGFPGMIWEGLKTALSWLGDRVSGAFSGITSGITAIFSFDKIGKAIGDAMQGMGNIAANILHTLANNAGPFKGAIEGGARMLGIPGFARGGYIDRDQLAIVGEEGPELFLPKTPGMILPNNLVKAIGSPENSRSGGSFSSGNIHISGPVYIVANEPEEFYRKLNVFAGKRAEFGLRGSVIS